MALPQTINTATPASGDSPSGAPALFQNIKQFVVDVLGITDNTAYNTKALDIAPATSIVTVQVVGFGAKDLTLTRGSLTSAALVLDSSVTWTSASVLYTGWKLNVTDTTSSTASVLMDLQVGGASKFTVKKDGSLSAPIGIGSGGTGLTAAPTNGQLPIGNGTGYTLGTITGTVNQVTVTNSTGSITLSLPQNIHTTSGVVFSTIQLGDTANAVKFGLTNTNTLGTAAANRTWTLPDVSGTVLTTGNMTSITTVGTITSGVWNGTAIGSQYGGTGLNASATSGAITVNSGTWTVTPITNGAYAKGTAGNMLTFQATPLPTADLATGTASATTFLRGDQTWASAGGIQETDFTTAGNWTVPAGVTKALIEVWGAGGGGGGGKGNAAADGKPGGGGGGGEYAWGVIAVTPLAVHAVTVGGAGAAGPGGSSADGTAGGNGGNTSVGVLIQANGGSGGGAGAGAGGNGGGAGGAGGTGGGATNKIAGQAGAPGEYINGTFVMAGMGGGSFGAQGGQTTMTGRSGGVPPAGQAGQVPGGGGGGGCGNDFSAGAVGANGGAGGAGLVRITYTA